MKRREKKKGKEEILKASITVEASYIVVIIIFIIFAILVISFYFYDAVTAEAILEKNIAQLQNIVIHPFEKDSYYYDYNAVNERFLYSFSNNYKVQENMGIEQIKKELNSSLILLNAENINVNIRNKKLTASVELSCGAALLGTSYIPFFGKTRKVTTSISVYHQADFIRILTIIDR